MKYALNIGADNRILSVTYEKYATPNMPIVDAIPDRNIVDFLYINGEYVYDPLPKPPEPAPEPTADELLNIILGVTE